MELKDYIQNIIRPKIQGDGGEVNFVGENSDELTVLFQGECSKCLILDRCVDWIAAEIKRDLGREVSITVKRKKPFFWDFG